MHVDQRGRRLVVGQCLVSAPAGGELRSWRPRTQTWAGPRWSGRISPVRRRFPVLVEDPGETHAFRKRFHQAVSLCLLYRLVGTGAAVSAFAGHGDRLSAQPQVVYLLVGAYCLYTAGVLYRIGWLDVSLRSHRLRLGSRHHDWLDRPVFIYGDVAGAVALNLVMAMLLRRGEAYSPYADVFTLALITSVVIWSGRRGGREGFCGVIITAAVEIAQAPLNGIALGDINWPVVSFRTFWVLCGWVVAVGIVRILLDYAERSERLRLEDEMLTRLSRSHNDYKEALRGVVAVLSSHDEDKDELAIHLARQALAAGERRAHDGDDTVEGLIADVIEQARASAPATFEFVSVNSAHDDVRLREPRAFREVMVNLCSNAARHSKGSRATIRWGFADDALVVTVRDDGIGYSPSASRGGLALADRLLDPIGGELVCEQVTQGTKWVLRLPASAYQA